MSGSSSNPSETGTEPDATIATQRRPAALERVPEQGERVGRFIVVEPIGRGAMGVVLLAYDPKLHREVALKLLRFSGDDDAHVRLVREAQAMAKLNHPNVVAVYDVDVSEGYLFVAMEYVPGTTLRGWMEAERRSWPEVVAMFVGAGRGLVHAHARGLVHRDFKPSNVLVGEDGRPRVTDFGLVRGELEAPSVELSGVPTGGEELATGRGAIMGTPAYMAPEQWTGTDVGPASDQYAFCVALWEALHAERPFDAKSREHMMVLGLERRVRAPANRAVPRRLNQVLHRGLAPKAAERFSGMSELLERLPRRRRRWVPGAALGMVAAGATAAALSQTGEDLRCTDGRAKLTGAWDDERKSQLEQVMLVETSEFATQTWARVEEHLAGWADRWVLGYDQACRATQVEQVQSTEVLDRRVACLVRMRSQLDATVELLAERDDATMIGRAVDLVTALPDPDRCADVERLLAAVSPPDDPQTVAEVEQVRARLDRVRASLRAGRPTQAREGLDAVDQQIAEIDYRAIHAEVDLVAGRILEIEGRFEEAETRLRRSFRDAVTAGDDARAATAASALITIIGNQKGRAPQGEQWIEVARALGRRLDDPQVEGTILSGVGTFAAGRGRYEEALEAFVQQLDAFERAYGDESPRTARAHTNVAGALSYLGRPEDAVANLEQALAIERRALGEAHPRVGQSLAHLGLLEVDLGRREEGIEHMERGLALASTRRAGLDPAVAGLRINLASALRDEGRSGAATRAYERAEAELSSLYGEEHPYVALAIRGRAELLSRDGRSGEARTLLERVLSLQEAGLGPEHPEIVNTLIALGAASLRADDVDHAATMLSRAHGLAEGLTLPDPNRAELELLLARALVSDPAQRSFALRLASAAQERESPFTEEIERFLADHGPDASR